MREWTRFGVSIVLVACAGAGGYAVGARRVGQYGSTTQTTSSSDDRNELQRMYEQDQADRSGNSGATDWTVVEPRDRARRERVRKLVAEGMLATANDYYHAAMVLQHGGRPEEYILAHDLAVAAAAMGQRKARWLAAATEDRFLRSIGRPQRFGTQFRKDGDRPWYLEDIDPDISDKLRAALDVPSVAESVARVAELNRAK